MTFTAALLGDHHGNGVALDAILSDIDTVDQYVGLGDYLFPSAGSARIVEWLREHKSDGTFVRGNHDVWRNAREHRDSWDSDPTELMRFVDAFPERREMTIEGHRLAAIHGYPVHPEFQTSDHLRRPLPPEVNLPLFRREYIEHFVDVSDVDVLLWGDLHLPYVEVHPDLVLVNPGAAGLSADQLLQQVSYMILEIERDGLTIDHRRVPVRVADVIDDVSAEWANGDPAESWLVRTFYGESRIQTRDWRTCWGRIDVERTGDGYHTTCPMWELVEEEAAPTWE